MQQVIRQFLSSDGLAALTGGGALVCVWISWRIWRDPNSWHIDAESQQLAFHAWPQIAMSASLGAVLAILTFLIL